MMFVMSADPKLAQWQGTLGEPAGADGVHEPQVGSDERLLQRLRKGQVRNSRMSKRLMGNRRIGNTCGDGSSSGPFWRQRTSLSAVA